MRLILVLEVEPIGVETFREWPLHCTLVHWFNVKGDIEHLILQLKEMFTQFEPIELLGGEEAMFGPKRNMPVDLVKDNEQLHKIHTDSVELLGKLGVIFTAEQFLREGYRPHVTLHGGRRLGEGGKHISKGVYLVQSTNESPKERKVITRFQLGAPV